MVNVHFNGDLVRCPDFHALHLLAEEKRINERRCVYGIREDSCYKWRDYVNNRREIKKFSEFGRCFLSGSEFCPFHTERVKRGSMQKTFKIDAGKYRQLSSAAHYLLKIAEHKVLFLTLTFPKFKKQIDEKTINELFSDYVEKLRKNGSNGYLAVRERGSKNGRYHFHLIIDLPFIRFDRLNSMWIDSIKEYCDFSKNAVQSDRKARFIKDPIRAVRYICKYISKSRGQTSNTRLIFISNNINIKHKQLETGKDPFFTLNDLFDRYKSISVYGTSDYTTLLRINDKNEFYSFCHEYLYKLFEIPDKNAEMYCYPLEKT